MDTGITAIAAYLAGRIPTGAEEPEQATQDWRTTLYNARRTRAMGVVSDMVRRAVPDDERAQALCDRLLRR